MPAKSKAQYRLMKSVEHGSVKVPGLSKKEASEFTRGQNYKKLPERKKTRKKGR